MLHFIPGLMYVYHEYLRRERGVYSCIYVLSPIQGRTVDDQPFQNEYSWFIEFDNDDKFLRVIEMVDSGRFLLFFLGSGVHQWLFLVWAISQNIYKGEHFQAMPQLGN